MLDWAKLLNPTRRKSLHLNEASLGTKAGRDEFERDYDRILFSAPTRRLADKTQVFPMEQHDSVRTRLTHSYEVSNLARSIGVRLAFEHAEAVFGKNHEELNVKRSVPALLAAIGLAHDLGNPPFGHQGEESMQQWFKKKVEDFKDNTIESDFLSFDGNAQTFRLLTKLQILNDDYGLNLTLGTLAALIKYPSIYGESKFGFSKWGVFCSEREIVEEVWSLTGLEAGVRHPMTVIMEACDDIAYSIIDAEDTVKKGYASFYDLMDYIEKNTSDGLSSGVAKKATAANERFRSLKLSSRELNDVSMQIFRAISIAEMIAAVVDAFVLNIGEVVSGDKSSAFELVKRSRCADFCKCVKDFDRRHGFQHRDVLKLELEGNNYIHSAMDMLWGAVNKGKPESPFEKYVYGGISENYRRIYEGSAKDNYAKRQLICDAVSGMTESYLVKNNKELRALCDR
ncbi:Deoxyguanosinetriphosphate triphosphohydrolase [Xanthomonas sacchari]|uniref:dGTP triphosphohydrolase n=1 Tax=Xanthomonas sacchari TaxID=56458 RepID=UPI00224F7090|nr:dNTP triphosphohydrolase [Xanthomonas sacchari]MCW0393449.1 Deoxyguanosinetriphosphate triphosphohydrolase [Xanthomonas sacchari]MCW0445379.1 Deoxyguanosinetriphosphate triphosphohydrolase [Xanthomonas sacchari]